jgi:hypothetical protein
MAGGAAGSILQERTAFCCNTFKHRTGTVDGHAPQSSAPALVRQAQVL